MFRLHPYTQHRAGDVKFLTRQRTLLTFPVRRHHMIRQRQTEMLAEIRRAANGENRATAFQKPAELRQRSRQRHVPLSATILGRNLLPTRSRRAASFRWRLVASGIATVTRTVAGR